MQEWSTARDLILLQLDHKVKEPRLLLFFCSAIYICTYNNNSGLFSHS